MIRGGLSIVLCLYFCFLAFAAYGEGNRESADYYYKTGMQLQQNNQVPQAVSAFKKALELNSKHEPSLLALSLLYLRINALDEAEMAAKKVLKLQPNHAAALNNLALVYFQRKNVPLAVSTFEQALSAAPRNVQIRKNLAFALMKIGRNEEAVRHYEQLAVRTPQDVELVNIIAANYYSMHKLDKALEWLKKSIKLDGNNAETHYSVGTIYYEKQLYQEALDSFRKAATLNPKQIQYQLGLAKALFFIKKYRESYEICEAVVKQYPNNPEANKLLIEIREKIKLQNKFFTIIASVVILIAISIVIILTQFKKRSSSESSASYEEWERALLEKEETPELPGFILMSLREFLSLPEGAVFLVNAERTAMEVAFANIKNNKLKPIEVIWNEVREWVKSKQYNAQTLSQAKKHHLFYRAFPGAKELLEELNLKLLIPIVLRDKMFGMVALGGLSKNDFSKVLKNIRRFKLDTLKKMIDRIATAVEISTLYKLSVIDENTGLYNKRYLSHCVTEEIKLAAKYGQPCSLLMFDLDYFKQINDTYGHPQGDAILKELAVLLKLNVREGIDVVARYGGEEFTVILPGIGEDKAFETAELIRESVAKHKFLQPAKAINMTISIGSATYPEHAVSEWELLKKADIAMYYSKKNGRNQVTVASKYMEEADLRNKTPEKIERILPSFQSFQVRMAAELEKAQKDQYEVGVCLIEIKNFQELGKSINIIHQLIGILQPLLRIYDIYGLYNEMAMMVLLPERSMAEAKALMDKFLFKSKEHRYYGAKSPPELCVGIVVYPHNGKDVQTLLEQILVKERYISQTE